MGRQEIKEEKEAPSGGTGRGRAEADNSEDEGQQWGHRVSLGKEYTFPGCIMIMVTPTISSSVDENRGIEKLSSLPQESR